MANKMHFTYEEAGMISDVGIEILIGCAQLNVKDYFLSVM